jgi:hypothetical protein
MHSETTQAQCSFLRTGPLVRTGRWQGAFAWSHQCQRTVRVPAGTAPSDVRCWQHPKEIKP